MANDKKSFLLYCDIIHTVEKLPDEKAGQLLKHILKYTNDLNPETDDILIQLAFEPIKQSLKRDLRKFERVCERNRNNGKLGGRPKKEETKNNPNNPVGFLETQNNPIKPKKADSDSDSDSDIELSKDNNNNLSVNWSKLLEQFNSITGKKIRVLSDKAKKQIKARLKDGYTKEDIVQAIINCFNDSYHRETGHKYLTPEFISRSDKMEKYANVDPDFKPPKQSAL